MTWFLATMSGPDVAAAACILAALPCLFLRHRLPIGLGAAIFALAATVGATLTAFHHQWPGDSLLDRAAILGASLCVSWAVLGRVCSGHREEPPRVASDVKMERPSSRSAETFFAFAFLTGSISTVAIVLPLIRTTWFRLVVDPLAPIVAMTWPGVPVIAALAVATHLSGGAFSTAERNKRRHPATLLALAGLAVWWISLVTPSASLLGEIPESERLFGQPGWWTWTVQLQIGLAAVLVFSALLQDRQYRSRRRNAWPDALDDLVSPYSRWPGYIQVEAVIGGLILLLGVLQLMRSDRPGWQLPLANSLASAAAGAVCLFMTYRRWSGNTAGLGSALVTLAIVAMASAIAAPFYSASPWAEYVSRVPVLLNALLFPLWVAIGLWNWLSRLWDQQLLNGVPWTTAGRMIPIVRRTAFLLAAIAVLIAFQMALWPTRPIAVVPDNTTWRWICGIGAIALLLLQSIREARRRDSSAMATIAMAFFIAAAVFVFVRLHPSHQRGWLIQYDCVVLSAVALPILLAAELLQKSSWRAFSTPLWFLALLILPLRAMLELLSPVRLPAEWVRPTTLAILAVVYGLAGRREHRRAFLILGAVVLLAAVLELFRLLKAP
jgi:hypothetical protein